MILTLVALVVVAAVGLLLVETLIRDSRWGVGLVLLVVVLRLLGVELDAAVLGFRVGPSDVVGVLLIVAAVARMLRQAPLHPAQWALVVYGVLIVWGIATGIGEHGAGSAVNEARKYIGFAGAALYGSTIALPPERRDRYGAAWIRVGALILVVVILRWAVYFTGLPLTFLGTSSSLRVIPSFETLVLLQAVVLATWALVAAYEQRVPQRVVAATYPMRPRWLAVIATVGAAAVILLQHRTLWAELALVAVLLLVRVPAVGRRLLTWGTLGIVLVTVVAFAALGEGTERIVVDDLTASASNVDTFSWRVEGWADLYESQAPDDPVTLVLGRPFGGGFPRIVSGRLVEVSPHNFYLELLLRLGVLGLALFVGLHVWVIARAWRRSGGTPFLREDALAVVLIVSLVQNATSHPLLDQGLPLGLAIASLRLTRPRERAATDARGAEPAREPGRVQVGTRA